MEKNKNMARLFGNNPDIGLDERTRVIAEIEKIGGSLTFKIEKDENGWIAQCTELEGILASGLNPNPSNDEIESQIRDAVYAAFNVQMEAKPQSVKSPYNFGYSFA